MTISPLEEIEAVRPPVKVQPAAISTKSKRASTVPRVIFIFAFLNNSSNSLSKELTIVSQRSGKDKGVYGFLAGHTD